MAAILTVRSLTGIKLENALGKAMAMAAMDPAPPSSQLEKPHIKPTAGWKASLRYT